jgi:cytochrome c554/c'-like protein
VFLHTPQPMGKIFRDSGHLIRPALVILAGLAAFGVLRQAVIPKAFGQYGHYRPGALELVRNRPLSYGGQQACLVCHEDQGKARAAGKHAHVACEACHGPLAKHAEDPGSLVPKLPEVAGLCVRCHEKDAAKPRAFPQVVSAEHSGGMVCNSCHQPHNPHL